MRLVSLRVPAMVGLRQLVARAQARCLSQHSRGALLYFVIVVYHVNANLVHAYLENACFVFYFLLLLLLLFIITIVVDVVF